ncbi:ABC transporter permease [Streptomyces sp. NBC_00859]|uniref:ABC transporter permease n=1 Tax=Streptomyces sp. NBC_00859 TaxID=2903682 RepID=UPI003865511D|nr:ABC transporter permease [Streptomyces sp. NBC_00859]
MIRFLVRRLAELLATLLVASFLIFASVQIAPGRPETFLLGGRAASPEALTAIRERYHLDDPFFAQYWHWLSATLHGDLGISIQYRSDVSSLIASRLPVTLQLLAMSTALVIVVGVTLGTLGAVRRGPVDTAVNMATSAAVATPSFVAAIGLLSVFSVRLGWFPALGAGDGPADTVWHLTLPAIALALPFIGVISSVTRASVIEQAAMDHTTVARARGVPERVIIRRHLLRGSLGVIVTQGGLAVANLVVSTVLVEYAFGLGGLGDLLAKSVTIKDFPVAQGISLLIIALFICVNAAIDLLHPLVDPRTTLGARNTA